MPLHALAKALAHLSHLSYPEIYLTIIASGHPLPVPEGVIFVALGVIAGTHLGNLFGFILVAALAAFTYDLVLYGLAFAGTEIAATLSKKVKKSWTDRYSSDKSSHMMLLTLTSHFVPGWRMLNPVIAAGLKIRPKNFVLYTLVSAIVYPSIYILIGFFLTRI